MKQQQNRSENLSNSRKSRKQQEKQKQLEEQERALRDANASGEPYLKSHLVNVDEYMSHAMSQHPALLASVLAAPSTVLSSLSSPTPKTSSTKPPAKGFQLFRPLRKDSFSLGGSVPKISETGSSSAAPNSSRMNSNSQSGAGGGASGAGGGGAGVAVVGQAKAEEIKLSVRLMTEMSYFADNQPFHEYFEELLASMFSSRFSYFLYYLSILFYLSSNLLFVSVFLIH
jgi:hypothetical protein